MIFFLLFLKVLDGKGTVAFGNSASIHFCLAHHFITRPSQGIRKGGVNLRPNNKTLLITAMLSLIAPMMLQGLCRPADQADGLHSAYRRQLQLRHRASGCYPG